MSDVLSIDARTGEAVSVYPITSAAELDTILDAAARATAGLDTLGRLGRARMLRAGATALEQARTTIVDAADRESALGRTRLDGELTRTWYQLRFFADVIEEGSYLELAIDHAQDTPMGPRPDLRRMLLPIGPVAVFGASNFPLAFSVAGGDTASALAAGNPVVVKVHDAHPATSLAVFEALEPAFRAEGAPEGTLSLVFGFAAGVGLVQHPAVRAVGFTGSQQGGRALLRLIGERPDPIPFYGELSGLNPVIVTPTAAAERAGEIGAGLVASFTLGAGQFCTKPGLVFVPTGAEGDTLVRAMTDALAGVAAPVMLTDGIATAYRAGLEAIAAVPGSKMHSNGERGARTVSPSLVELTELSLPARALEECFGPVTLVRRYRDLDEALALIAQLPPSLTASVHSGIDDAALLPLADAVRPIAGRLVHNGYPTGVAVSWAQHHGGPWPATNSIHTSVGATSIRRFLRPFAWQSAPEQALPTELRDADPGVPRRVDGVLQVPGF
jgi:NADP-dependent aldehyde dehydrogenase